VIELQWVKPLVRQVTWQRNAARESEIAGQSLTTRLYAAPPARPELVPWPRLIDRLHAGAAGHHRRQFQSRCRKQKVPQRAVQKLGCALIHRLWITVLLFATACGPIGGGQKPVIKLYDGQCETWVTPEAYERIKKALKEASR
jgi:hypothetical protein